jgi:hypothetical protein
MTYWNTSKSSRLISRPGKAGSYKQPLIQRIVHAVFDPLGMKQHFPCDSNFLYNVLVDPTKDWTQVSLKVRVNV